jgi:hypothetical protein
MKSLLSTWDILGNGPSPFSKLFCINFFRKDFLCLSVESFEGLLE